MLSKLLQITVNKLNIVKMNQESTQNISICNFKILLNLVVNLPKKNL